MGKGRWTSAFGPVQNPTAGKIRGVPSRAHHAGTCRLVLGTMMFGDSIHVHDAWDQMDYAFDWGVSSFDTAEMYPVPQRAMTQGASERCVGEWIRNRGIGRDSIDITTKVSGPGGMSWLRRGPERLDRENIIAAVEGSLIRLQTDYIDMLLLHWPDRYVPMFGESMYDCRLSYGSFCSFEEQMEAIDQLHRAGKIRSFGLSNETPYGVMTWCTAAGSNSEIRPRVIQNAYNLLCRTFDTGGLAECCYMEGVGLMAYSPLAMGLLSGKYSDGGLCANPQARLIKFKGRYAEAESRYGPKPNVYSAIAAYVKLAQECGIAPVELALRFVLSHPQMAAVVVGASSMEQLKTLVAYRDVGPLDDDILQHIDDIHQRYPSPNP